MEIAKEMNENSGGAMETAGKTFARAYVIPKANGLMNGIPILK